MIINPPLHEITLTDVVGIDTETSGLNPNNEKILVIAITTKGNTFVIDVNKYDKFTLTTFLKRLQNVTTLIAHNAKFDASFLYTNFSIEYTNWFCTQLASEILENKPERVRHNLPATIMRYLGIQLIDDSKKRVMQRSFVGLKLGDKLSVEQLIYAGEDTKYLIDLYKKQAVLLRDLKLDKAAKLDNRLLTVLMKMEVGGCLIDVDNWKRLINDEWLGKKESIEQAMDDELRSLSETYPQLKGKFTRERKKQILYVLDIFGNTTEISNENKGNVNYGSQDQIKEIFRVLNEPIPLTRNKKTKEEKESVDENSLKTYVNENPQSPLLKFLELLLEYREYGKLISTYGEKFLSLLDENNCIHTSFSQCKTATGRLSSLSPNLQNIPSRGNGGKLRDFFISKPGYSMVTCDMASAEVYIAADYSQDQLLLDSILNGDDMHSKLASVSFSIIFDTPVKVTKSEDPITIKGHEFVPDTLRTVHKSVLFAKFYKAGAARVYQVLAKYINIFYDTPEERLSIADKVSLALDKELPKLSKYLSDIIDQANKKGYLRGSKLGRIRWFKENAYGDAANMPIQNTNSEAMKIALINIDKYLEETGYGRLVLTVHDESLSEVKDEYAEEAAKVIRQITADALSWFLTTVKGGASINIKKHWEK